ncbi:MAG: hypothetical protein WB566_06430 [Terriglobales bacterium]
MKYLRYVALLALLALPIAYAQAAVVVRAGVGVGVGVGGYVAGPPVCSYGYYPDYPYACAPYGYYGPGFFVNGAFIGAGPWYHGWGHPYYGRPYARGFVGRGPVVGHGFESRGSFAGDRGGFHGGGFRGRR